MKRRRTPRIVTFVRDIQKYPENSQGWRDVPDFLSNQQRIFNARLIEVNPATGMTRFTQEGKDFVESLRVADIYGAGV